MGEHIREDVLVSVVMPAYNAEKTIAQSIQSVLCQTYKKLELIIVDDASTDRTLQIAITYAKQDPRIRIIENVGNLGVSCSRNHGVEASLGSLIAFLDSDDMWQSDKLEKQYKALQKAPACSICFTGSAFIDENDHFYQYTLPVPKRIGYEELLRQNLISCSSVLAKRETLLLHPMISDPMIHEDYATWLKILKEEPYAIGIDEPLLIYRIGKHSKSGNKLRAAKMQWNTYKVVGIKRLDSIRYFTAYAWRNLQKYARIRRNSDRSD